MYKKFMQIALNEAKNIKYDVPVAAVVVYRNKVLSVCSNRKEKDIDLTAHAEILAIKDAQKKLNTYILNNCDIYVTLEPCPMCMWAILSARFKNLYFSSYDTNYGAAGSRINLAQIKNSKINIKGGILEECGDKLLNDFFKELR